MNNQELQPQNNVPKKLVALATLLFIVFVVGLLWLAGAREQAAAGGTFGFMALLAKSYEEYKAATPAFIPNFNRLKISKLDHEQNI